MKIGNEYVQIKKGNKTYIKKNTILDTFLQRVFNSQINPTYSTRPEITNCYIKLDTPLENITTSSTFTFSNDFDIKLYKNIFSEYEFKKMSTILDDRINVRYRFTNDGNFQYKDNYYGSMNDFNMFNGRKITAIGFGLYETCYAVVDVSDMNIIINKGEELSISREDIYESDGICDKYDYPLHLVNFTANKDYDMNLGEQTIAQLYSVGLGNTKGIMETEHVIDFESNDVVINDDNISITFIDYIMEGIYPSETLFPRTKLRPQLATSKYIYFKYKLSRIDTDSNITGLDEYYIMSCKNDFSRYIDQEGGAVAPKNITLNLSIERI